MKCTLFIFTIVASSLFISSINLDAMELRKAVARMATPLSRFKTNPSITIHKSTCYRKPYQAQKEAEHVIKCIEQNLVKEQNIFENSSGSQKKSARNQIDRLKCMKYLLSNCHVVSYEHLDTSFGKKNLKLLIVRKNN